MGVFVFLLFQWLRPAKQFSNSKFTLLVFTAVHDGQLGCLDRCCCCCCCLGKTKDLEYLQGATRNRYSERERERETLVLHKLCCCIYSALVETLFRVPLKPAILCGNCAWYTQLVASKNCPFAIFQGASWLQIYLHTQFSTREDRFFSPADFGQESCHNQRQTLIGKTLRGRLQQRTTPGWVKPFDFCPPFLLIRKAFSNSRARSCITWARWKVPPTSQTRHLQGVCASESWRRYWLGSGKTG